VEFAPDPDSVRVRVTLDSEAAQSIEQQRDGRQAILDKSARHVGAKRHARKAQ
jgi:hypothetical protein